MGFPEGTQGESAKGAPKTEASRQGERRTYKTERASERGAVGKKLGVSSGNARRVGEMGAQNRGESARGAPNKQNRKNKRRGAVGRKLGVSRGNARRVGRRGAQHRGESPRGAPNQQNRKSQRQRCGGVKTWGFQRDRKASRPEGRPEPRRVFNRSAQTQHKASSRDGRPNEKLVRNENVHTREH